MQNKQDQFKGVFQKIYEHIFGRRKSYVKSFYVYLRKLSRNRGQFNCASVRH